MSDTRDRDDDPSFEGDPAHAASLQWGSPPSPRRGYWWGIAAACRARPGEWAAVPDKGGSYTNHVTTAKLPAFGPPGSFEARSHYGQLWIRYVGKVEASSS